MVLFFWATNGAPALYGHVLFSAHMVQHMVLAMVVPLFLALSAPVTLALRALPVRSTQLRDDDSRGPREWILAIVDSHVGHFLAHPVVAAVNFIGSMLLFYYSGLFEWSLRSRVGHLAMVVHFTARRVPVRERARRHRPRPAPAAATRSGSSCCSRRWCSTRSSA